MKRHHQRTRRGASTVEFALVVPVMLIFTFGVIEISRISMFKESITQATREGARVGIKPTASASEVVQRVEEELAIMGISDAIITIEPSTLGAAQADDSVKVHVSVPVNSASWVGNFFNFGETNIEAATKMRRESTG